MNPFDALLAKLNINLSDGTKTAVIIVVGLLMAFFAFGFLKSSFEGMMYRGGIGMGGGMPGISVPSMPSTMPAWQEANDSYMTSEGVSADYAVMEGGKGMALGMPSFSVRNAAPDIYPPRPGMSTGNTAEEYEVSDYNASIETTELKKTCAEIAALKSKKEVIFESASESDTNCFYSFKVEHASVDLVLGILKTLNPRDLSENTYTIKSM